MMKKIGVLFSTLALLLVPLSGCGTVANTSQGASDSPITLQVYDETALTDQEWQTLFVDPLHKKYPNVTLDRTVADSKDDIKGKVASGYTPDLLFTGFYWVAKLTDIGIPAEIDDLVKKDNVDLSKFNSVAMDSLKGFKGGKLIGLPFFLNTVVLEYNKDIFDKFGVSYPTDGMTWDQAVSLAQKVTKTDNGVNYQGLSPGSWDTLGSQLSIQKIDPASNKAIINNDGYKKVFQLLKQNFSIPGMDYNINGNTSFYKDRNVAMNSYWLSNILADLQKQEQSGQPLNWDFVTVPTFADKPGVGAKVDAHILMLCSQSQHKDQAFQVMNFLTTSQDVQTLVAKSGKMPALSDPSIQAHFGEDYPGLKGKNVQAIFKNKMAPLPPYSPLEDSVKTPMANAVKDVILKNIDINTALAKAEDDSNKAIQTALQGQ